MPVITVQQKTKTILITGGSRGIGASIARLAAKQGFNVCITYFNDKDTADSLIHELTKTGIKVKAVQSDVGNEKDVIQLFQYIDREFGNLWGLVNNAGIAINQGRLETYTKERIERVFSTNVFGPIYCSREAVKRMSTKQSGTGGVIINISSIAARLGSPGEYIDYAASKGAIDTLTIGLAKEIADEGIRVNAVSPGLIDTEFHAQAGEKNRIERIKSAIPMQRPGQASEVADSVMFLLSDKASYITGSILDVSGGR
ncbi:SDR family oxidoreductase [Shewanella sp. VB17]|uniref:SDR family oxidoreductase n=1 Tax=Shewanella sp. VB17 TaxID=2739432 RepID=UPI0015642474|nr:SDR family oxidoreductase [Shewanella sp. VB17]NRD75059.1 SDR family oxidoreductase [Shewanella sp. VB17]